MLEKVDNTKVLSSPTDRVVSWMDIMGAKKISSEGAIECGSRGEFDFFVLRDSGSVVSLNCKMKW